MNTIFEFPEIPTSIAAGLFFAALVAVGIVVTRRFVHARVQASDAWNGVVEMTLTVFTMFYGILLGLLVVSSYENVNKTDDVVSREASVLSVLYRHADYFPEPARSELQESLLGYAQEVVDHSFAQQAQSVRPTAERPFMDTLFQRVDTFVPTGANEVSLQAEMMRQLSNLQDARRGRLSDFDIGIPTVLWWIVGLGAVITLALVCLLDFPLKPHLAFGCLLAFFIGATIFVTASMDNPYAGSDRVGPDKIQYLLDIAPPAR